MQGYSLGIELGSTRIKAVLVDENTQTLCTAIYDWEDHLVDGYWSYDLEDVKTGLRSVYKSIAEAYFKLKGSPLTHLDSIGISAMMHGYLAFDRDDKQLVPFRTWRNTNTGPASKKLSKLLAFNMPHRWSICHYYQAILNGEDHVGEVCRLHTLASYVHYLLTGEYVIGIGDASGMFPISPETHDYDERRAELFNGLPEIQKLGKKVQDILPKVLLAGQAGGKLTEKGAAFLDPDGHLQAGALCCPPEGDAGTGMVATNAVREGTGNVSCGTSIFSMIVLEKALKDYYPEIDIVTTPNGKDVAMVHCNNGTPELDSWILMFRNLMTYGGVEVSMDEAYNYLFNLALEADKTCGGIQAFNYLVAEPVAKIEQPYPLYYRTPDSRLNAKNFLLAQLYAIFASLKIGMDLLKEEQVPIHKLVGHGGVFKTKKVMAKILASILEAPVATYDSAGEGGAWGIAVLARYAYEKSDDSFETYVDKIFEKNNRASIEEADPDIAKGFTQYFASYKKSLEKLRALQALEI